VFLARKEVVGVRVVSICKGRRSLECCNSAIIFARIFVQERHGKLDARTILFSDARPITCAIPSTTLTHILGPLHISSFILTHTLYSLLQLVASCQPTYTHRLIGSSRVSQLPTASCRPIRHHDHACSSELWHPKSNKRITLLFLLVVKITIFTKPSSRPINHHFFPLIIVAHDNAETLGAQDSDSAFSFHRVVDIVQKPVPHCSILAVH
jgi:hypothetical protein